MSFDEALAAWIAHLQDEAKHLGTGGPTGARRSLRRELDEALRSAAPAPVSAELRRALRHARREFEAAVDARRAWLRARARRTTERERALEGYRPSGGVPARYLRRRG